MKHKKIFFSISPPTHICSLYIVQYIHRLHGVCFIGSNKAIKTKKTKVKRGKSTKKANNNNYNSDDYENDSMSIASGRDRKLFCAFQTISTLCVLRVFSDWLNCIECAWETTMITTNILNRILSAFGYIHIHSTVVHICSVFFFNSYAIGCVRCMCRRAPICVFVWHFRLCITGSFFFHYKQMQFLWAWHGSYVYIWCFF